MNATVLLYEELSLNALPASQTQFYDGWVLRFTPGSGYNRANSVNMLYPSTLSLQEKITECENRYFKRGQPAVFKITDGSDVEVEELLKRCDYDVVSPTYFMTADLSGAQFTPNASCDCIFKDSIDEEWSDAYFSLSKFTDDNEISVTKQILNSIKVDVVCGKLIKNGSILACGLCVIERGYAGLFNVVVDEQWRGNGYGKEICMSLLSTVKSQGVHTAYLQVLYENDAAAGLYAKLGFKTVYSYWYRTRIMNIN